MMGGGVASSDARAVLLHGFTGSSRAWGSAALDGLRRAGVGPTVLDLPGHGSRRDEVSRPQHGLDGVMASVGFALGPRGPHEARPGPPPALVGYSMGGRLALHFAVRHPERLSALVLESASPGLPTEAERAERRLRDETLAQSLESEGIERFVERWESLPLFASRTKLPERLLASIRAARLANDPGALAASLRELGTGALPSLWDRLSDMSLPTLVVVGAADAKFVEIGRRMVDLLPDARLAVIEGCGHTVHLENPSAWVDVVGDFVARHALEWRASGG